MARIGRVIQQQVVRGVPIFDAVGTFKGSGNAKNVGPQPPVVLAGPPPVVTTLSVNLATGILTNQRRNTQRRFPWQGYEGAPGGTDINVGAPPSFSASSFVGVDTLATDNGGQYAQPFNPLQPRLAGLSLWLLKSGTPSDNLRVQIQTDSGGSPSGTVLSSALIPPAALTAAARPINIAGISVDLTVGQRYWIVVARTGATDNSNFFLLAEDSSLGLWAAGQEKAWGGASWAQRGTNQSFLYFADYASSSAYPLVQPFNGPRRPLMVGALPLAPPLFEGFTFGAQSRRLTEKRRFPLQGWEGWGTVDQLSGFTYYAPQGKTFGGSFTVGDLSAETARAISFTGVSGSLGYVELPVVQVGTPSDNLVVEIQTDAGGSPSNTVLASASIVGSSLPTGGSRNTRFALPVSLDPAAVYWIVVRRSGSLDVANYYAWQLGSPGIFSTDSVFNGSVWSGGGGHAFWFALGYDAPAGSKSVHQYQRLLGPRPPLVILPLPSEQQTTIIEPTGTSMQAVAARVARQQRQPHWDLFPPTVLAQPPPPPGQYRTAIMLAAQARRQSEKRRFPLQGWEGWGTVDRLSGATTFEPRGVFRSVNASDSIGDASAETARAIKVTGIGGQIDYIKLGVFQVGSPTDNIVVEIRPDAAGSPSATVLASTSAPGSSLPTSVSQTDPVVFVPGSLTLVPASSYWIVVRRSGAIDAINNYQITRGTLNIGASDMVFDGATWTADGTHLYFAIEYEAPAGSTSVHQYQRLLGPRPPLIILPLPSETTITEPSLTAMQAVAARVARVRRPQSVLFGFIPQVSAQPPPPIQVNLASDLLRRRSYTRRFPLQGWEQQVSFAQYDVQVTAALRVVSGGNTRIFGTATIGDIGAAQRVNLTGKIFSVRSLLSQTGSPGDQVNVQIQSDSGGVPSGTVLGTSNSLTISAADEYLFTFPAPVSVSGAVWLVFQRTGALSDATFYRIARTTSGDPIGPAADQPAPSTTWVADATVAYNAEVNYTTATAVVYRMPFLGPRPPLIILPLPSPFTQVNFATGLLTNQRRNTDRKTMYDLFGFIPQVSAQPPPPISVTLTHVRPRPFAVRHIAPATLEPESVFLAERQIRTWLVATPDRLSRLRRTPSAALAPPSKVNTGVIYRPVIQHGGFIRPPQSVHVAQDVVLQDSFDSLDQWTVTGNDSTVTVTATGLLSLIYNGGSPTGSGNTFVTSKHRIDPMGKVVVFDVPNTFFDGSPGDFPRWEADWINWNLGFGITANALQVEIFGVDSNFFVSVPAAPKKLRLDNSTPGVWRYDASYDGVSWVNLVTEVTNTVVPPDFWAFEFFNLVGTPFPAIQFDFDNLLVYTLEDDKSVSGTHGILAPTPSRKTLSRHTQSPYLSPLAVVTTPGQLVVKTKLAGHLRPDPRQRFPLPGWSGVPVQYGGEYQEPPVLDNFNRPNEDPLVGDGFWGQLDPFDANHLILSSNAVQLAAGGGFGKAYWLGPQFADVAVQLTIVGDQPKWWVNARLTGVDDVVHGAWNGYELGILQFGPGLVNFQIDRVDAGSSTTLASTSPTAGFTPGGGPFPFTIGDKFQLRCIGTRLEGWFYHNGGWTLVIEADDATYSFGYVGIESQLQTPPADDFAAGPLVPYTVGTAAALVQPFLGPWRPRMVVGPSQQQQTISVTSVARQRVAATRRVTSALRPAITTVAQAFYGPRVFIARTRPRHVAPKLSLPTVLQTFVGPKTPLVRTRPRPTSKILRPPATLQPYAVTLAEDTVRVVQVRTRPRHTLGTKLSYTVYPATSAIRVALTRTRPRPTRHALTAVVYAQTGVGFAHLVRARPRPTTRFLAPPSTLQPYSVTIAEDTVRVTAVRTRPRHTVGKLAPPRTLQVFAGPDVFLARTRPRPTAKRLAAPTVIRVPSVEQAEQTIRVALVRTRPRSTTRFLFPPATLAAAAFFYGPKTPFVQTRPRATTAVLAAPATLEPESVAIAERTIRVVLTRTRPRHTLTRLSYTVYAATSEITVALVKTRPRPTRHALTAITYPQTGVGFQHLVRTRPRPTTRFLLPPSTLQPYSVTIAEDTVRVTLARTRPRPTTRRLSPPTVLQTFAAPRTPLVRIRPRHTVAFVAPPATLEPESVAIAEREIRVTLARTRPRHTIGTRLSYVVYAATSEIAVTLTRIRPRPTTRRLTAITYPQTSEIAVVLVRTRPRPTAKRLTAVTYPATSEIATALTRARPRPTTKFVAPPATLQPYAVTLAEDTIRVAVVRTRPRHTLGTKLAAPTVLQTFAGPDVYLTRTRPRPTAKRLQPPTVVRVPSVEQREQTITVKSVRTRPRPTVAFIREPIVKTFPPVVTTFLPAHLVQTRPRPTRKFLRPPTVVIPLPTLRMQTVTVALTRTRPRPTRHTLGPLVFYRQTSTIRVALTRTRPRATTTFLAPPTVLQTFGPPVEVEIAVRTPIEDRARRRPRSISIRPVTYAATSDIAVTLVRARPRPTARLLSAPTVLQTFRGPATPLIRTRPRHTIYAIRPPATLEPESVALAEREERITVTRIRPRRTHSLLLPPTAVRTFVAEPVSVTTVTTRPRAQAAQIKPPTRLRPVETTIRVTLARTRPRHVQPIVPSVPVEAEPPVVTTITVTLAHTRPRPTRYIVRPPATLRRVVVAFIAEPIRVLTVRTRPRPTHVFRITPFPYFKGRDGFTTSTVIPSASGSDSSIISTGGAISEIVADNAESDVIVTGGADIEDKLADGGEILDRPGGLT